MDRRQPSDFQDLLASGAGLRPAGTGSNRRQDGPDANPEIFRTV
jgi:hypothetical protein